MATCAIDRLRYGCQYAAIARIRPSTDAIVPIRCCLYKSNGRGASMMARASQRMAMAETASDAKAYRDCCVGRFAGVAYERTGCCGPTSVMRATRAVKRTNVRCRYRADRLSCYQNARPGVT